MLSIEEDEAEDFDSRPANYFVLEIILYCISLVFLCSLTEMLSILKF